MTTKIPIELSVKGGSAAEKAFDKLNNQVTETRKDLAQAVTEANRLDKSLKGIDRALDAVDTAAFKRLPEEIDKARKASERLEKQQLETAAATEKIANASKGIGTPRASGGGGGSTLSAAEERRRRAFDLSDPVGDVDTGVAAFAGAFGQFGGAGVEQAARGISDVLAISEAAPRIVASLGTIAPAMVATTAGLGVAALAFYALNKAIDASAESAKKNIEAINREIEAQQRRRDDLRNLSAEQARQQSTDISQDINLVKAQLAALDRARDESRRAFDEAGSANAALLNAQIQTLREENSARAIVSESAKNVTAALSVLGEQFGINIGAVGEYNKAVDETNRELAESKRRFEELTEVLAILQAQEAGTTSAASFVASLEAQLEREMGIIEATNSLTGETARLRLEALEIEQAGQEAVYNILKEKTDQVWADLAAAVDRGASQVEIEKLTAEATGLQNELNTLFAPLEQTNRQIEDFNNLIIPAIERREREARAVERFSALQERAADLSNRAAAALEKLTNAQQQLADFEGSLATEALNKRREASINAVYDAQIAAIDADIERAKASEKVQQAQVKAVQIQSAANEKVRDTNAKFFEQELARLAEFRKAEARINDDFARDQRRRLEDLNDELSEASAENDVVAFIQAQKEGSKELARAAEDFSVDASRRVEDFNAETQRNHADHTRQLFEIDRQYQEQKLQLQATAGGQELSLLEQLQSKRAEIIANREASLEQFRQSLEQDQINRRRAALIAQMNAAQQDYNRLNEMALTNGRVIGSNFMASIINGASSQINQAFSAVNNAVSRIRIPSFANGTIATHPMVAAIGDTGAGWHEAVIPFRASRGLTADDVAPYMARSGGANKPSVTVHNDFRGAQIGIDTSELESRIGNSIADEIGA